MSSLTSNTNNQPAHSSAVVTNTTLVIPKPSLSSNTDYQPANSAGVATNTTAAIPKHSLTSNTDHQPANSAVVTNTTHVILKPSLPSNTDNQPVNSVGVPTNTTHVISTSSATSITNKQPSNSFDDATHTTRGIPKSFATTRNTYNQQEHSVGVTTNARNTKHPNTVNKLDHLNGTINLSNASFTQTTTKLDATTRHWHDNKQLTNAISTANVTPNQLERATSSVPSHQTIYPVKSMPTRMSSMNSYSLISALLKDNTFVLSSIGNPRGPLQIPTTTPANVQNTLPYSFHQPTLSRLKLTTKTKISLTKLKRPSTAKPLGHLLVTSTTALHTNDFVTTRPIQATYISTGKSRNTNKVTLPGTSQSSNTVALDQTELPSNKVLTSLRKVSTDQEATTGRSATEITNQLFQTKDPHSVSIIDPSINPVDSTQSVPIIVLKTIQLPIKSSATESDAHKQNGDKNIDAINKLYHSKELDRFKSDPSSEIEVTNQTTSQRYLTALTQSDTNKHHLTPTTRHQGHEKSYSKVTLATPSVLTPNTLEDQPISETLIDDLTLVPVSTTSVTDQIENLHQDATFKTITDFEQITKTSEASKRDLFDRSGEIPRTAVNRFGEYSGDELKTDIFRNYPETSQLKLPENMITSTITTPPAKLFNLTSRESRTDFNHQLFRLLQKFSFLNKLTVNEFTENALAGAHLNGVHEIDADKRERLMLSYVLLNHLFLEDYNVSLLSNLDAKGDVSSLYFKLTPKKEKKSKLFQTAVVPLATIDTALYTTLAPQYTSSTSTTSGLTRTTSEISETDFESSLEAEQLIPVKMSLSSNLNIGKKLEPKITTTTKKMPSLKNTPHTVKSRPKLEKEIGRITPTRTEPLTIINKKVAALNVKEITSDEFDINNEIDSIVSIKELIHRNEQMEKSQSTLSGSKNPAKDHSQDYHIHEDDGHSEDINHDGDDNSEHINHDDDHYHDDDDHSEHINHDDDDHYHDDDDHSEQINHDDDDHYHDGDDNSEHINHDDDHYHDDDDNSEHNNHEDDDNSEHNNHDDDHYHDDDDHSEHNNHDDDSYHDDDDHSEHNNHDDDSYHDDDDHSEHINHNDDDHYPDDDGDDNSEHINHDDDHYHDGDDDLSEHINHDNEDSKRINHNYDDRPTHVEDTDKTQQDDSSGSGYEFEYSASSYLPSSSYTTKPEGGNCMGVQPEQMTPKLQKCCKILDQMQDQNITDYSDMASECLATQVKFLYRVNESVDLELTNLRSHGTKCLCARKKKVLKSICCLRRSCDHWPKPVLKSLCSVCEPFCSMCTWSIILG